MYMPVVVYSEDDAVLNHGKELAARGSRALILTGRFSAKNCGALDDTIKVLDGYGITYHIFNRVEENPSTHTVVQAAEEGRNEKADFVIGIGGGSPLDAAKAAAFLMCCGEIKEELLSLTIISIIFAKSSPAAVRPNILLLLLPSKLPTHTPKT